MTTKKGAVADRKAIEKHKRDIADIKFLLEHAEGRRFLWRLLDELSPQFHVEMTGNSWTFFNLGKKDVGNVVLGDIFEVDPHKFAQMIEEDEQMKKDILKKEEKERERRRNESDYE